MMTDLLLLPLEQRIALAQGLWESVHADAHAAPFTPEQIHEVEQRIAAADAGLLTKRSWSDVRAELASMQ